MDLTIEPHDVTEGRMCVIQCTALLDYPKMGGAITWKMKDTITTDGDRIKIETDFDPKDPKYVSRLTLNESSWTDTGGTNLFTSF